VLGTFLRLLYISSEEADAWELAAEYAGVPDDRDSHGADSCYARGFIEG
jgi:hypothetical protein